MRCGKIVVCLSLLIFPESCSDFFTGSCVYVCFCSLVYDMVISCHMSVSGIFTGLLARSVETIWFCRLRGPLGLSSGPRVAGQDHGKPRSPTDGNVRDSLRAIFGSNHMRPPTCSLSLSLSLSLSHTHTHTVEVKGKLRVHEGS